MLTKEQVIYICENRIDILCIVKLCIELPV